MADATVHADETVAPEQREQFSPFQWHRTALDKVTAKLPARTVMELMGEARDIASGGASLMALIEWDDLQSDGADDSAKPLLNNCHRANMRRLLATSLQLLERRIEEFTSWSYEHHTPEGIAERRARGIY